MRNKHFAVLMTSGEEIIFFSFWVLFLSYFHLWFINETLLWKRTRTKRKVSAERWWMTTNLHCFLKTAWLFFRLYCLFSSCRILQWKLVITNNTRPFFKHNYSCWQLPKVTAAVALFCLYVPWYTCAITARLLLQYTYSLHDVVPPYVDFITGLGNSGSGCCCLLSRLQPNHLHI